MRTNNAARVFATLRAALNAAMRQRKIPWNPAIGVELDSAEARERQRWTPAQAAQFIAATASDPMGLMFRVAVLRGCRRGELCGFRAGRTPSWTSRTATRRPARNGRARC